MRDAPSIPLITALQDMGAKIRLFDPVGMPQAKKVIENVTFCKDAFDCARAAHAIVIVTEWEQFRALDLRELASVMASSVIVDLRNIYSPEEVRQNGFHYCGVGRPKPLAY
jgi:UDPglucose 6-dehydrogenase